MQTLGNIAAGLVGLFSIAMGLMAWFSPAEIGDILGIGSNSVLGDHTIRGDVGAIFLASAVGCFLALFKGKPVGMKLPIIIYGLVLTGRLLSLVLSGGGEGVMQPILIEIVLIGLSVFAYRSMKNA